MDIQHLKKSTQRVLLIRRKALGDCLVTLNAVRELSRWLPSARIDLVIDKPFADLVALLVPEVKVLSWAPGEKTPWDRSAWYRQLRSQNYDLVIDWLGNPRTALWTAATSAPVRVGYDLPRRRWAYNVLVPQNRLGKTRLREFAGESFLDPLRALGLTPEPWQPGPHGNSKIEIPLKKLRLEYCQWRDNWLDAPGLGIGLMMSATWPAKAWPNHSIVSLWEQLKHEGLKPVFIPGPGDEEMETILREGLPAEAFAVDTSLIELADLLGHCAAFAGTDCGGRHLASALGLPTVTLFGPTNSGGWNPNHPRHVAIKMECACLGCELKHCPLPERLCLDNLPASRVAAGLFNVLENLRK